MIALSAFRPYRVVLMAAFLVCAAFAGCRHLTPDNEIHALIRDGAFTRADAAIADRLARDTSLTAGVRLALQFERERMARIRLDFRGREPEVRAFITKWIPGATDADYRRWEASGALEMMVIDGEKCYFNSAARNLFRIDTTARRIWREKHRDDQPPTGLASEGGLNDHLAAIMAAVRTTGKNAVLPVRMQIEHTIRVDADAVPPGEMVRCWIPFPREIPGRQEQITLVGSDPSVHLLADTSQLQRTIYFERLAVAGAKTVFSVTYDYTSNGLYYPVDPFVVVPVTVTPDLEPYLREEPPHIMFTPELRALSAEVVGSETNPLLKARKLFAWMDRNIPWASAREYSTVPSLSSYAFANRHGDCGIQTTLFITLLRLNGIPARWQSGWEFRPPGDSMHDWGMVYFAPYGWVPMDATYGMRNANDDAFRYFYVNGMDSYRLIFNDAAGTPFYPAKVHPRSETVDSQRGEVEWRGGNLYFDKWDWELRMKKF
jgi:hypothetical protein